MVSNASTVLPQSGSVGTHGDYSAGHLSHGRSSGTTYAGPGTRASQSSAMGFSNSSVINEHRNERMVRLIGKLSSSDPAEQARAAELLFNMTHKDTLDRQKLYAYGAIPPLVSMLSSSSE